MAKKMHRFLLSLCLLPISVAAHQVIGIQDGDTLTLLVNRTPLKIRLSDIDAPEKKQAFGQRSKQSLSDLCWGTDATFRAQTIDKYGRTVARVTCAGVDANRVQVERRMAWVCPKYNKDASLPAVENAARAARRGLWADNEPMPPWEFRHPTASNVADKSGCLTGPRGGRYQLVDGRKRYGC